MEKITQKFVREVIRARKSGIVPASLITDDRYTSVCNALLELGATGKYGASLPEIVKRAKYILDVYTNYEKGEK